MALQLLCSVRSDTVAAFVSGLLSETTQDNISTEAFGKSRHFHESILNLGLKNEPESTQTCARLISGALRWQKTQQQGPGPPGIQTACQELHNQTGSLPSSCQRAAGRESDLEKGGTSSLCQKSHISKAPLGFRKVQILCVAAQWNNEDSEDSSQRR